MTPNETKLTEAMSSALANVDPVIAQDLKRHIERELSVTTVDRYKWLGMVDGAPVVCEQMGERIWVAHGNSLVPITPEGFKVLSAFAAKVGWTCD